MTLPPDREMISGVVELRKTDFETVRQILAVSFERPGSFPGLVDEKVTRNRSLRSDSRRELTALLHDSIRWRRRIFGDISPTHLEEGRFLASLSEARNLKGNPPVGRWSSQTMDTLARELSYPTWIIDRWVKQFGFSSAVSLALSLNEPAPVTFRVNTLKVTRSDLIHRLDEEGLQVTEGSHSPVALHLPDRKNLRSTRAFRQGLFEIQDEGSQLSVLAAGAQPGQTVIDACAGAGGKSLALAASMENKGSVLATDSDARPLEELSERAKRAGATIVKTAWVAPDDPMPLSAFREKADLVFVDAPCSGLGTLRRRAWMKWNLIPEIADRIPAKQLTLLRRYSQWVKTGGALCYVTCTLHAPENEGVVEAFLSDEKRFRMRGEARTVRPDVEGCDGFYFCTLEKSS
ncbi:MAG: RNA methyltransferase [Pseudomonadota bacterium]